MLKSSLGNGTDLFLIDELPPEDVAMLQALYSRSGASVTEHMEKVRQTGSGRFMAKFYVNYSHKSIADCGTTTLFIEGVSILAAKVIQDNPLYNGQETSTRYIDMGTRRIVDPFGTPESKAILDAWMSFYVSSQEAVAAEVKARYPKGAEEKEDVYERAVKARTFDILRGFLPAGITTQLAWHTNLRQAGDNLPRLRHHPLPEVQEIGSSLKDLLLERYPSSFGFKEYADKTEWEKRVGAWYSYSSEDRNRFEPSIDPEDLELYDGILRDRPRGATLPHFLSDLGLISFNSFLDFGSFRDIQRHRNGVCRMPLLTMNYGFATWYIDQLPEALQTEAYQLIAKQMIAMSALPSDLALQQYYIPLGYRVPTLVTYGLPAAVYVMELRSGRMVHPTLRSFMHEFIGYFQKKYPTVTLHVDESPDDWDVRRGTQTITEKA